MRQKKFSKFHKTIEAVLFWTYSSQWENERTLFQTSKHPNKVDSKIKQLSGKVSDSTAFESSIPSSVANFTSACKKYLC